MTPPCAACNDLGWIVPPRGREEPTRCGCNPRPAPAATPWVAPPEGAAPWVHQLAGGGGAVICERSIVDGSREGESAAWMPSSVTCPECLKRMKR